LSPFVARTGLAAPIWPCPFIAPDRRSATHRRNDANDPGCVKTLLRCYDSLDDSRERVDEALH
jgi:hypothetical protein